MFLGFPGPLLRFCKAGVNRIKQEVAADEQERNTVPRSKWPCTPH